MIHLRSAGAAFDLPERLQVRLGLVGSGQSELASCIAGARPAAGFDLPPIDVASERQRIQAASRAPAARKRVPIWKKEFYADGSAWLDGQIVAAPGAER